MQQTPDWSLCWEDPPEEGTATYSNILARRVPWTEEPGGLHSPQGRKESDTTTTQQISVLYCLDYRNFVLSFDMGSASSPPRSFSCWFWLVGVHFPMEAG